MHALLCRELGSYENLTIETIDEPQPGPGEVLIDVRAAGVNFPDLLMIAGRYQAKPTLPFVPGGECAGVISGLGDGVTGLQIGARVIATVVASGLVGAFSEKLAVPAKSIIPMPEGMPFETGAGVAITYGTSLHALEQRANLAAGETLLVLGAGGGVGLAAVQLGKAMGARVVAAASSAAKLEAAREAGADEGIDYSNLDPKALQEQIKDITNGGADVVYDPVGGAYSEAALRAIAWDGRFLVVGFAAGEIPKIPLNLALLKGARIVGVFWGSWAEREPAASAENFRRLANMFADGQLRPQVTTFPLASYRDAFASLAERRAVGKLVLTMA